MAFYVFNGPDLYEYWIVLNIVWVKALLLLNDDTFSR